MPFCCRYGPVGRVSYGDFALHLYKWLNRHFSSQNIAFLAAFSLQIFCGSESASLHGLLLSCLNALPHSASFQKACSPTSCTNIRVRMTSLSWRYGWQSSWPSSSLCPCYFSRWVKGLGATWEKPRAPPPRRLQEPLAEQGRCRKLLHHWNYLREGSQGSLKRKWDQWVRVAFWQMNQFWLIYPSSSQRNVDRLFGSQSSKTGEYRRTRRECSVIDKIETVPPAKENYLLIKKRTSVLCPAPWLPRRLSHL